MTASIAVGMRFSSYEELQTSVNNYEKETSITFWKRESKTLVNASKKYKSLDTAPAKLKYYIIKYACVAGGREHKKKCVDGSRKTKTFRQNCPAFIHVLLTADRQFLEVKSMNENHNHMTSETLFRSLPKERRLPIDYQEKVQKLLSLQVNKKLLQEEISKETGKNITLKDLSNIAAKRKKSSNDFDEILHTLQNVHHCSVSVLKDDDDTLQGLFFQDHEMKDMYKNYPEVMFFDGTYKLINSNFTCYIFLIEEGNGYSEVVGVGLLGREDKESVRWLVGAFKQSNDKWCETRVIVTDKELTERVVFHDLFPSAQLEICLFHTFKTFKREITPEKMGVSKEVCDTAKEYLKKLAYCQSEESYSALYESFKSIAPPTVMKYYNDNWHDIRKEWTYMSCINGNFLNMTNNRLESINGKLKTVVKKFSSFPSFIEGLFSILNSMRKERNHASAIAVLKIPSQKFPVGSPEESYQKILNPYPFDLLLKQLNMSRDPKTTLEKDSNFTYECQGNSYPVSSVSCQCLWHNAMKLPCRHILSVRRKLSLCTFDPSLCDKRWLRSYLDSIHRVFIDDNTEFDVGYSEVRMSPEVPKTTTERYAHILALAKKVAAVAAESTGIDFLEKENALKQMLSLWEKGQKITVCAGEPVETEIVYITPDITLEEKQCF